MMEELIIEVIDAASGDTYFYYEEDMLLDISCWDSIINLSKMIDDIGM